MKLSCKVMEDLLPLYRDGVCSEESRQLVDEHLRECAACKDVLHSLNEEVVLGDQVEKAQPLLSVKMTWNKEKRKAFLKGLGIALAACIVLVVALIGLTQWKCVPMGAADLLVAEVRQLENGAIYYELGSRYQDFGGTWEYQVTEEGICYFVCKRAILEPKIKDKTEPYTYVTDCFYPDGADGRGSLLNHYTGDTPITAFYFGAPGDCLLVWEEGMELLPASDYTESIKGNR